MKSKRNKGISLLLVFMMILSLNIVIQPSAFAVALPDSAINVSTGHSFPINVITGPDEKLYVSEYNGNKIIKMDKDGQNKTTFTSAITQPIGMVFDADGNLYVAEHNGYKVTKFDSNGNSTLVKDISNMVTGLVMDSNGKLFVVNYSTGKILKMDKDGSNYSEFATGFRTTSLIGMTIDANDNLYVSDRSNGKIIKIAPNGTATNFITGVSSPNWVTFGKDGYFYVSTGNRTIEKFDLSGTKVQIFSTGMVTPWGTAIDADGYIYFTDGSSTTKKIVGSALTTDTTHLVLTMNTVMSNTSADPMAFSLSGTSSNPQVVSAVVSGSSISLTLNAGIATSDINIKVNYTKTGTNNLLVSGSGTSLNNFSNLPVVNNVIKIMSTSTIAPITVANGTAIGAVALPTNAIVSLSNSTTSSAAITWDNATPSYNGSTAGTYVFSGTFALGSNISNPNNVKASVNVIVAQANVVITKPSINSVQSIAPITVANGTSMGAIGLPSTATLNLSNSSTSAAAITWDSSTPAYNGATAGTYVFTGIIELEDKFLNPSDVKASVTVIVQAAPTPTPTPTPAPAPTTPIIKEIKETAKVVETAKETSVPATQPQQNKNTIIKVNGVDQSIGTEIRAVANGISKVDVSVNSASLQKNIDEIIKGSASKISNVRNVVEINVQDATANSTNIALTGEIIKTLDNNAFTLQINRGKTAYSIAAKELTVDAIAKKLSISEDNLKSIKFDIQIKQLSPEKQTEYNTKIKGNNSEMLIEPTEFKIVASVVKLDGTSNQVDVKTFTEYVQKTFEIPSNLNLNDITTGIVFNDDLTYSHVPTNIFTKEGKLYAQVNSLSNSVYSVIKNPIKVESVKGHWSEAIVNDMASRLIVTDYKNFKADENITRGELADYIVRALGLFRSDSKSVAKFKDVNMNGKNDLSIALASEWGIITGYADGTFKPSNQVTRAEAMVMYAKAMDIVKYENLSSNTGSKLASNQTLPKWAASFMQKTLDGKVFVGRSDNAMDLKANLTHSEALAALKNLLSGVNLINKK